MKTVSCPIPVGPYQFTFKLSSDRVFCQNDKSSTALINADGTISISSCINLAADGYHEYSKCQLDIYFILLKFSIIFQFSQISFSEKPYVSGFKLSCLSSMPGKWVNTDDKGSVLLLGTTSGADEPRFYCAVSKYYIILVVEYE